MINNIKITNHLGESITIMMSSETSGLIIESINGLGPAKGIVSMTSRAGADGSIFSSARVNNRNILITFSFEFNPDIETVRQLTYKYFPIKQLISLEINTDNRNVRTEGYVESNEPSIFTNEAGTTISILCPDPFLYDLISSINTFSSVTPLFEFLWEDDNATSPTIVFSSLDLDTEKVVIYNGDAPVGIIIKIYANGDANNISITNSYTLESISIDSAEIISITGGDIQLGDKITISTIKGDKYAILLRGLVEYNILNALGQDPDWLELHQGDNVFSYDADSGVSNIILEILNEIAYEGV